MAQDNDMDAMYKALRFVPDFDGNPHVLTRFIKVCDQLVLTYFNTEAGHELSNVSLINGILNKVTGSAARLINSNGIPDNWQGIRNALINNFADHRDETALYNDLSLQTQGSSTPQEFYERCQNLFSTIMTYISLHETVATTIEAKRNLYKKLTLQCYLRGLKDPLGCRIRCMRPTSMEMALELVQEELNTLYLQQRNEGSNKKDQPMSQNHNLPLHNFAPKPMAMNTALKLPISMTGPSWQHPMPSQPTPRWRSSFPMPGQQNRGPTRTMQMMRAPPQNYNSQSHAFKLSNRPQPQQSFYPGSNGSRPMSGVRPFIPRQLPLTSTLHDWNKSGNPPPGNYFKTREVNFNEFDYNPYFNQDNYTGCDQNYCPLEHFGYPNLEQYCYEEPTTIEEVEQPTTVEEVEQPSTPSRDGNFLKESNTEKPK